MSSEKKMNFIEEEGVKIYSYGEKISKELTVFYNPVMKLNRDISLLVIATYFKDKKIKFCDPMSASGIREIRFLKTIPEKFEKIIIGDISQDATENIKKNFENNNVSLERVNLICANAINTISSEYFDFIEIDPFGSPVPFLDMAAQRIKHNGILSVTATDTAALCGTYPKTTLRKYNIKIEKTLWHEELGLRNLIAYTQRQVAKYDKIAIPLISYSNNHYFKIFFKVEDSKTKAVLMLKELAFIEWDKKTQESKISKYETEHSLGKTYIGPICDKQFLKEINMNLNLIQENAEVKKLIDNLQEEIDIVGYYNTHKFMKKYKFTCDMKFETIINELKKQNYQVSRAANNFIGIKTNCPHEKFIEIMKGHSA